MTRLSTQGDPPPLDGIDHADPAPPFTLRTFLADSHTSYEPGAHRNPNHPAPRNLPLSLVRKRSRLREDVRRDSGLAPSARTTRTESLIESGSGDGSVISSQTTLYQPDGHDISGPSALAKDSTTLSYARPAFRVSDIPQISAPVRDGATPNTVRHFRGITTVIPSGGFEDLTAPEKLEFSKRGSMLFNGKRMNGVSRVPSTRLGTIRDRENGTCGTPEAWTPPTDPRITPSGPLFEGTVHGKRVLSAEEILLSRQVRSKYERGDENGDEGDDEPDEADYSSMANTSWLHVSKKRQNTDMLAVPKTRGSYLDTSGRPESALSNKRESRMKKEPFETAGGIEDWQDVDVRDVDRYGFIVPRNLRSQAPSRNSNIAPGQETPRLKRPTTALQWFSASPRRKRTPGRAISSAQSFRSSPDPRAPSQQSMQPPESVASRLSRSSFGGSLNRFRYATNRLPYNRDRRWMDEASDMLTLPPGLAEIAEQEEGGRAAFAMKKKEWSREEKWRKMARVTARNSAGGGMSFDFDTRDEKLISRTWKGIPDRWRATAWHAFLSASAKRRKTNASDEELMERFQELQEESSADDAQIDVDVPRTINSHIMFRRRYRGGQRLLFRVLHALSLYFPDTGYVQGMASLATTLLCYYDEEKAFVMLVRLWQLRGLERLYQPGFAGLMEALEELETRWLAGGEVGQILVSVSNPSNVIYVKARMSR